MEQKRFEDGGRRDNPLSSSNFQIDKSSNLFRGCEVPETMVNPVYMGTLPDMSEADPFDFGRRIFDCGISVRNQKSEIRN